MKAAPVASSIQSILDALRLNSATIAGMATIPPPFSRKPALMTLWAKSIAPVAAPCASSSSDPSEPGHAKRVFSAVFDHGIEGPRACALAERAQRVFSEVFLGETEGPFLGADLRP